MDRRERKEIRSGRNTTDAATDPPACARPPLARAPCDARRSAPCRRLAPLRPAPASRRIQDRGLLPVRDLAAAPQCRGHRALDAGRDRLVPGSGSYCRAPRSGLFERLSIGWIDLAMTSLAWSW